MGLRESALGHIKHAGGICTVQIVRQAMAPSDRKEMDELLADSTIPATALSRALKDAGHEIAALTISRHRTKDCKCPR